MSIQANGEESPTPLMPPKGVPIPPQSQDVEHPGSKIVKTS
jgi:hypothetical protein